jgi:hypothetical protein
MIKLPSERVSVADIRQRHRDFMGRKREEIAATLARRDAAKSESDDELEAATMRFAYACAEFGHRFGRSLRGSR